MTWDREAYLDWVMTRKAADTPAMRISADEIVFPYRGLTGKVMAYPKEIMELSIVDEAGENHFYLHFHLEEKKHAQQLTNEMLRTLLSLQEKKGLRILLTCTSALTTSFFASELNHAAEVLKLEYRFSAVSFDHIWDTGFDYDVILLAPQIAFQYEKVKEIFHHAVVLKIPSAIFARYNTGEMIDLIRSEYDKARDEGVPEEILPFRSIYDNSYRILTIAVINHSDGNRFGYRIYDHGQKTLDKEVIKPDAGMQDFFDLLDYVFARHKNIDYIGISVPGVVSKGTVDEPRFGFNGDNLSFEIYRRYHVRSAILNDVNAMALGYHAMHEGFDDMAFYFLPRGLSGGGAGLIMDGKLRRGYMHIAGEVGKLTDMIWPNPEEMVRTPEGAMKMVVTSLMVLITSVAPEKIVYYSELTPNEEEVRRELAKHIDESYIPELIHVRRLKRYQLPGTMIRCLEVMKYDEEHPDWWDGILKRRIREYGKR